MMGCDQSCRLLDWIAPRGGRPQFQAKGCSNWILLLERMKNCNNQSLQLSFCRMRGDNVDMVFQVVLGSQKWGWQWDDGWFYTYKFVVYSPLVKPTPM